MDKVIGFFGGKIVVWLVARSLGEKKWVFWIKIIGFFWGKIVV